jgi:hypothetical protein
MEDPVLKSFTVEFGTWLESAPFSEMIDDTDISEIKLRRRDRLAKQFWILEIAAKLIRLEEIYP